MKKLPAVIWFTGLSGSGKSTVAELLIVELAAARVAYEHLDGDLVRDVFPKTGFTREARYAHLKRIGFIASLLEKHSVTVVCTFVSPYQDIRELVRGMCSNFIEVHISTPLAECERRDVKGLYARARAGEIQHFTGLDDPYEEPVNPDLSIDTTDITVDEAVNSILEYLELLIE